MAEESIDYKVNIDTSSVAEQLQAVKNQIDQAMAQYTFRATAPDPVLMGGDPSTVASAMTAINQPTTQLVPPVGLGESMSAAVTRLNSDFNESTEAAKLGFQKFNNDMQNFALSTPIGRQPFVHDASIRGVPEMDSWGGLRSGIEALTGFSYDPHMSLTRGEYVRQAQNKWTDNALKNTTTFGMGLIGSTVGGIFGGIAGSYAGDYLGQKIGDATYGTFASTFGQDYDAIQNMRFFARESSWRTLAGRFSNEEAERIGVAATKMGRTDENLGFRVDLKDVQRVMKEYTEAGGFDFARTAAEFAEKLKMVTNSITQVAETMRVSEKEAAQSIVQWDRFGLVKTAADVRELGLRMQSEAFASGYTADELAQFSSQTAEMVRGTGISMGSAYKGAGALLAEVQGMQETGVISNELVMQYGSKENIAASMARMGYEWARSPQALIHELAASAAGGQNVNNMSFSDRMGLAIGRADSMQSLLEVEGSMSERISNQTPEELFQNRAMETLNRFAFMAKAGGIKLNRFTNRAFAKRMGMSEPEADLLWAQLGRDFSTEGEITAQSAIEETARLPGILDVATDEIENKLAQTMEPFTNVTMGLDRLTRFLYRGATNALTEHFYGYREREANPEAKLIGKEAFWDNRQQVDTITKILENSVSTPSSADTSNVPVDLLRYVRSSDRVKPVDAVQSLFMPRIFTDMLAPIAPKNFIDTMLPYDWMPAKSPVAMQAPKGFMDTMLPEASNTQHPFVMPFTADQLGYASPAAESEALINNPTEFNTRLRDAFINKARSENPKASEKEIGSIAGNAAEPILAKLNALRDKTSGFIPDADIRIDAINQNMRRRTDQLRESGFAELPDRVIVPMYGQSQLTAEQTYNLNKATTVDMLKEADLTHILGVATPAEVAERKERDEAGVLAKTTDYFRNKIISTRRDVANTGLQDFKDIDDSAASLARYFIDKKISYFDTEKIVELSRSAQMIKMAKNIAADPVVTGWANELLGTKFGNYPSEELVLAELKHQSPAALAKMGQITANEKMDFSAVVDDALSKLPGLSTRAARDREYARAENEKSGYYHRIATNIEQGEEFLERYKGIVTETQFNTSARKADPFSIVDEKEAARITAMNMDAMWRAMSGRGIAVRVVGRGK